MLKVSRRGGFSDRNGIAPINKEIQLKDFDERTRNQICSAITYLYNFLYGEKEWYAEEKQNFIKFILKEVYTQPLKINEYYNEKKFLILFVKQF